MVFQVSVVSGRAAVDVPVAQFRLVESSLPLNGEQILPQGVIIGRTCVVRGQPDAVGRDGVCERVEFNYATHDTVWVILKTVLSENLATNIDRNYTAQEVLNSMQFGHLLLVCEFTFLV